jgi:hypothetical protein
MFGSSYTSLLEAMRDSILFSVSEGISMKMYKCSILYLLDKPQCSEYLLDEFSIALFYMRACNSLVVKALFYKPKGRGF